ncbi:MAG: tetratricopeptide repeat protein [Acidobacteriota bacterium]
MLVGHWAHNQLGNILYKQKRYYEAVQEYRKAIEIDRDYLIGYYNLGSAYDALEDKENAEKHWRFVAEHGKVKNKGKEAEERVKGERMEILVFVKETQPYFYARKYLGFLYIDKGLKEKAIKEFEEALKVIPSDAEIHYELGKIYMGLENKEKAIYHFESAIKNGTKNEREAKEFLKELRKK